MEASNRADDFIPAGLASLGIDADEVDQLAAHPVDPCEITRLSHAADQRSFDGRVRRCHRGRYSTLMLSDFTMLPQRTNCAA